MAPKVIRIIIQEMNENGEKYYLGKSPDVSGFLIEADTLEEAVRIAPEVMEMMLEMEKEDEQKQQTHNNLFQKVIYDINYNTKIVSHLQYT